MSTSRTGAFLALWLVLAGCDTGPADGAVAGLVRLAPGTTGTVSGARVELRSTPDTDAPPVHWLAVDSVPSFYTGRFALGPVAADSWYITAWKDIDGDGRPGDGDLVMPANGGRSSFGRWVMVSPNETTRVEFELRPLVRVVASVEAERYDSGRQTRFRYRFNHDVELTMVQAAFPGLEMLPDPAALGPKLADSTYVSEGWASGGLAMPTGWHGLVFRGTVRLDTFETGAAAFVR